MNARNLIDSTAIAFLIALPAAHADTHYVDPAGSNTFPYLSPVTAAHTIGAAVAVASAGDTVEVASAVYAEAVTLTSPTFDGASLIGTGVPRPHATGGLTLGAGLAGATVENMHFTAGAPAAGSVISLAGGVLDLTLEKVLIDGELAMAPLRHGFSGGQLEADATINRCEFKNVTGVTVFESRSGSGGGGSPLGTINFTNNFIHDCNGTVVFRGDSTAPSLYTPVVNISGNTWKRIGGAGGAIGSQWAAFEVNRAVDVNVFCNSVDDVNLGLGGEGQIGQFWTIADLDVHDNQFTNCDQGVRIPRVDEPLGPGTGVPGDSGDTASVFRDNNFSGNGFGIRTDGSLTVVDAENNWWGDATGPKDLVGTMEAASPVPCFAPADMSNVDGLGDEVLTIDDFPGAGDPLLTADNIDYCPWLLSPATSGTLELTADTICPDDADPALGYQVAIELRMRDLACPATGYAAFIEYDLGVLAYRPSLSAYSGPFGLHISPLTQPDSGILLLDGSVLLGSTDAHMADAVLARLVFDVAVECDPLNPPIEFDLSALFQSELSFQGVPILTELDNPPALTLDDEAPALDPCPADITRSADTGSAGGCAGAFVSFTAPGAVDNCDATPTVVCSPASGSFFPVGNSVVTCTATDACGNESMCTFNVTVTATNKVDVVVTLPGSVPATRCISFRADSCSASTDVVLSFTGSPATAVATIEIPCGGYTFLCAKDEQHTKWATSTLTSDGTKYTASVLSLDGGDTDNDGDLDINDVTLLIFQFGELAHPGGCPWDGTTRDANFSNDGAIGSNDHTFLTANWLSVSSCACTLTHKGRGPGIATSIPASPLYRTRVDLNLDGAIDFLDVRIFERRNGLSNALSEAIRRTAVHQRR